MGEYTYILSQLCPKALIKTTPYSDHKLMGFYMEVLILGVIL